MNRIHPESERSKAGEAAAPVTPPPRPLALVVPATEPEAQPIAPMATGVRASKEKPPLVLASVSLREDLEPTDWGGIWLQRAGALIGLGGAALLVSWGPAGLWNILTVTLLACMTFGSVLPMTRQSRLVGLLGCSLAVLSIRFFHQLEPAEWRDLPWLALGTFVLTTGLMFRHAHRASLAARGWVAGGLVLFGFAFVAATGWREWVVDDARVESWLPLLLWSTLLVLLLLSTLAFMGQESTGGSLVWAIGLIVWYAIHECARGLVFAVPPSPAMAAQGVSTVPSKGGLGIPVDVGSQQLWLPFVEDESLGYFLGANVGRIIAHRWVEIGCLLVAALAMAQLLSVLRVHCLRMSGAWTEHAPASESRET